MSFHRMINIQKVLIITAFVYIFLITFVTIERLMTLSDAIASKQCHEYKDWVNYSFISSESLRTGPGELGKPFYLTDASDKRAGQVVVNEYSYNGIVSDKISLDRSIPDTRPETCKGRLYYSDLPPVSVIIVFHDEYLSFLLRTIHSIFNRTPPDLLNEIILVDDASTKDDMKVDLKDHISSYNPKKIKLIQLSERSGLMRARMIGIKAATSEIVVVMDAHMEVNINWLPPLLQPIVDDSTTATEPVVNKIHHDHLEYDSRVDHGGRGGFSWKLNYLFMNRKVRDDQNPAENYDNPVFLGAIMAISREYFWQLGGYDSGLEIWGGEQYDISFKIWMSGGRILRVPCSQVGHNYKDGGHHPFFRMKRPYIKHNYNRVVEIYFDEYKPWYYNLSQRAHVIPGDVSSQVELRKNLKLKSFQWYLDNVYPELLQLLPINDPPKIYNRIASAVDPNMCLTVRNFTYVDLSRCVDDAKSQRFSRLRNGVIIVRTESADLCLEQVKTKLLVQGCSFFKSKQMFNLDGNRIQHNSKCLTLDLNVSTKVSMSMCDDTKPEEQTWLWQPMQ